LSGGAGTGKTVVALHRTRRLTLQHPDARILLTTFTRNLADDLASGLRQLDDSINMATRLDRPGVQVKGLDQVIRAILQSAGDEAREATATVLGEARSAVTTVTDPGVWKEAIDGADADLPTEIATPAFFAAEYELIILPNRITSVASYVRV